MKFHATHIKKDDHYLVRVEYGSHHHLEKVDFNKPEYHLTQAVAMATQIVVLKEHKIDNPLIKKHE